MTGKYRVRVTMHGEDRVLYLPGWIRLHKYSPRGASACPGPMKWTYFHQDRPGAKVKPGAPQTGGVRAG
jgi:hypothetical protein